MHQRRSAWLRGTSLPWLLVTGLAFACGLLWGQRGETTLFAQTQGLAGARGVYAFTGPIDRNANGLFMLDVDQGTLWCYEINSEQGRRQLRLFAARTWIYDRYLQDFNVASPNFREVQQLVAQQRAVAEPAAEPAGGGKKNGDSETQP